MSTYTQILYHIIFSTKHRNPVLDQENRPQLYKYIWGILNKKQCHLYRIGGISDHIHIASHVHPSVSLAGLVKDIKVASSAYIKENHLFEKFRAWQIGYAAFTYSIKDNDQLTDYIKNQEIHHRKRSFQEELIELLQEHGIEFDEKYLE
ncbi:MAG: IS200/IS605 family transposase [Candidatus Marinimicrobia bacterium]|jgi:REP element-mobilizing transposase RayT|nr:IS200/IS605 family transposase [Candidatus Neomarinimicrobiota bacterium]